MKQKVSFQLDTETAQLLERTGDAGAVVEVAVFFYVRRLLDDTLHLSPEALDACILNVLPEPATPEARTRSAVAYHVKKERVALAHNRSSRVLRREADTIEGAARLAGRPMNAAEEVRVAVARGMADGIELDLQKAERAEADRSHSREMG